MEFDLWCVSLRSYSMHENCVLGIGGSKVVIPVGIHFRRLLKVNRIWMITCNNHLINQFACQLHFFRHFNRNEGEITRLKFAKNYEFHCLLIIIEMNGFRFNSPGGNWEKPERISRWMNQLFNCFWFHSAALCFFFLQSKAFSRVQ